MKYLIWVVTIVALIISYHNDKQKTYQALMIAKKRLLKIVPLFFSVIIIIAVVMSLIPLQWIEKVLGVESGIYGVFLALGLGSVTMMPGFVAFPLSAALKAQGVTYTVLAAFTMTLMNVGVLTFPLEKSYLGFKVAITRNIIGLILAVIVTVLIAVSFREVILI